MSFCTAKKRVLDYYAAIEAAEYNNISQVLSQHTSTNWHWRGFSPCDEQIGVDNVVTAFWKPFLYAMNSVQRRQDIFFAGDNYIDNYQSVWVVSMGHLVGLFDKPLWGIQPTGKMAFFRYCEFNRIEANKIVETAFFFDIPHLMVQAGLQPFAGQRGADVVQPGPRMHDGLYFRDQAVEGGKQTLTVLNNMIANLSQWNSGLPLKEELRLNWHEDMIWWGPTAIGATYTIDRYAQQHAGVFRSAFCERSTTNHICRLAEGNYAGFFGWPNFTAKLREEYLGVAPSDIHGEFRVIDIYRRKENKLAENWVFIDFVHWFQQMGHKLLTNR